MAATIGLAPTAGPDCDISPVYGAPAVMTTEVLPRALSYFAASEVWKSTNVR
jgi:hypothetical protein